MATTGWTGGLYAQEGPAGTRKTPIVDVVQRFSPAVVNISTDIYESRPAYPFFGAPADPFFDDFFNRFFSPPRERRFQRKSLGSGAVIDGRGHIVTNHHVVLRASQIHVTMASGKEYTATLVGSDPGSDLAALKIEPDEEIPPFPLGRSSDLMIGETVIAIGNPFGLSHTVTTGVISAVNRSIQSGDQIYEDFIQTDASINPGNSGGPLLNIRGELIGINTAIHSEAQGIGFAIPVDRVRRIVDDLIEYGEVQPAWLGMEVQGLSPGLARYLGYGGRAGVLVAEVQAGGPAAKAGIEAQDILLEAAGKPLASPDTYLRILRKTTVNDTVTFRIFRRGRTREVVVKGVAFPAEMVDAYCLRSLGLRVGGLTREPLLRAGIRGVEIREVTPGSQAGRIGLKPGDVLLRINDREVPTVEQFRRELAKQHCRSNVTLQILRGRFLYYVTLDLRPPAS
jgi:Do/DeqQ family serine protease